MSSSVGAASCPSHTVLSTAVESESPLDADVEAADATLVPPSTGGAVDPSALEALVVQVSAEMAKHAQDAQFADWEREAAAWTAQEGAMRDRADDEMMGSLFESASTVGAGLVTTASGGEPFDAAIAPSQVAAQKSALATEWARGGKIIEGMGTLEGAAFRAAAGADNARATDAEHRAQRAKEVTTDNEQTVQEVRAFTDRVIDHIRQMHQAESQAMSAAILRN